MPGLLPGTLDAPSTRARWAALLTTACALITWHIDWSEAYDEARALTPTTTETHEWDEADLQAAPDAPETTELLTGIDDPAGHHTRLLTAPETTTTLELAWEAPLAVNAIRIETYRDAFGTGHRLGIAADSTTTGGPNCLNARVSDHAAVTTVQWCSRSDQHEPRNNAAFLGKDVPDQWTPDHLYVTQTANLTPPAYREATHIDFFGFGSYTGDAFDTGLWPSGQGGQTGADQHCDDHRKRLMLDDLHLSDERYNDPDHYMTYTYDPVYTATHSYPEEDRLITQACIPISSDPFLNLIGTRPFQSENATIPLAGWNHYNASTREPQAMRIAMVLDIRPCDTSLAHCTNDPHPGQDPHNDGPGRKLIAELLKA